MLNHPLSLCISFALLLTLAAGSTVAQQALPAPPLQPTIECGGQYECTEDRPITPAEAQASHSHPQHEQATLPQEPREVATTRPATTR